MLYGNTNLMEFFTQINNSKSNFYDILNEIQGKFKEKG